MFKIKLVTFFTFSRGQQSLWQLFIFFVFLWSFHFFSNIFFSWRLTLQNFWYFGLFLRFSLSAFWFFSLCCNWFPLNPYLLLFMWMRFLLQNIWLFWWCYKPPFNQNLWWLAPFRQLWSTWESNFLNLDMI